MIKKLSFFIFTIVLFSSFSGYSQLRWKYSEKKIGPAKNAVYAEIYGNGFQWSVNYERNFGIVLARVGVGYANQDFLIPVIISHPYKLNQTVIIEMGAGVLNKIVEKRLEGVTPDEIPDFEIFPTLNIAARFEPEARGYFFKVAFTPIFDLKQGSESYFFGQETPLLPMFLWGGVSFGVIF